MERDWSPTVTRRRALQMAITASIIGITGCTDRSGSDTTPQKTRTQQREETAATTTTKTPTDSTPDFWEDIEPTGIPAYHDDPNWRMTGHDTGNTFSNPHADGPDSDPTVRWTFDAGGQPLDHHRYYTPLIVDGTVYCPAARDDEKGSLVAIDAETGDFETVIETGPYLWKPTIVGGTVYAMLGPAVAAFDLESGDQLWQSDPIGWVASLRYVDGTLVGSKGDVIAGVDATSGNILWRETADMMGSGALFPVRADQTVCNFGAEYLRSATTGIVRSALPLPANYPVLDRGRLYGQTFEKFFALDWETLAIEWEYVPEDGYSTVGGYAGVIGETTIVEVEDSDSNRSFVGLDRDTGRRRWKRPHDDLSTMFVATDQTTAYVMSPSYPPTALDPQTGDIKWQFERDPDVYGAGTALADDLLVVAGGQGNVWALE